MWTGTEWDPLPSPGNSSRRAANSLPPPTFCIHPGGEGKADKPSSVLLLFYCIRLIKALSGPIFLQRKGKARGERERGGRSKKKKTGGALAPFVFGGWWLIGLKVNGKLGVLRDGEGEGARGTSAHPSPLSMVPFAGDAHGRLPTPCPACGVQGLGARFRGAPRPYCPPGQELPPALSCEDGRERQCCRVRLPCCCGGVVLCLETGCFL